MQLNAVPQEDYLNRDRELGELRRLTDLSEHAIPSNVLLGGARGIGKTELLKQFYRYLFHDQRETIPFYYCFQRALLKSTHFASDFFTQFVRQFLAGIMKDPTMTHHMSTPVQRLIPLIGSLSMNWLLDLIEDFQAQMAEGDFSGRILTAVSAPLIATAHHGKRVIVMLDDFHLAARIYDIHPGDVPEVISLFQGSMKAPYCPHIMAGSPEDALEGIYTDEAFRGKAERLFLKGLPADSAFMLLRLLSSRLDVSVGDECRELTGYLGGNPLYIRNLARSFHRLQRKNVTPESMMECLTHEVSVGETAFFWSAVLRSAIEEPGMRRIALELLYRSLSGPMEIHDVTRTARVLGTGDDEIRATVSALQQAGLSRRGIRIEPPEDSVLRDFITCTYLQEIKGQSPDQTRQRIMTDRFALPGDDSVRFEMTIPMASAAELVAARAMEQLGQNLNLKPDIVKQIQLALIEACINAMEHSGSYEKKVFLKFAVRSDRLEIVIESPGKAFDVDDVNTQPTDEKLRTGHTRGWGLQLMRKIMDEVSTERMDDRTRIILVKHIQPEEVN